MLIYAPENAHLPSRLDASSYTDPQHISVPQLSDDITADVPDDFGAYLLENDGLYEYPLKQITVEVAASYTLYVVSFHNTGNTLTIEFSREHRNETAALRNTLYALARQMQLTPAASFLLARFA